VHHVNGSKSTKLQQYNNGYVSLLLATPKLQQYDTTTQWLCQFITGYTTTQWLRQFITG
jgi:hypothetical protein